MPDTETDTKTNELAPNPVGVCTFALTIKVMVIPHLILASCFDFQNRFKCTYCEQTFETHLELYDHYRWVVPFSYDSTFLFNGWKQWSYFHGITIHDARLYLSAWKGVVGSALWGGLPVPWYYGKADPLSIDKQVWKYYLATLSFAGGNNSNFNISRDISHTEPTQTRTTSARDVEPVSTNFLSFQNTGSRHISLRCDISVPSVVRDLSLKTSWRDTWRFTVSFSRVILFTERQPGLNELLLLASNSFSNLKALM